MIIILALFITIIIWLFNLECNPALGHVWLRPNPEGNIVFAWRSLLSLLSEPFKNSFFWLPKNWDINFYTLFGIVYIVARILFYFTPV
jgi:hypothetical protein